MKNIVSIFGDASISKICGDSSSKNSRLNIMETHSGIRYIMCPHCFHIEPIDILIDSRLHVHNLGGSEVGINIGITANMTCSKCGVFGINAPILDNRIAHIIQKLNRNGYITDYCCDGHHHTGAYISFIGPSIQSIINKHPLPKPWFIDNYDYDSFRTCIRVKVERSKRQGRAIFKNASALKELDNWIDEYILKENEL